MNSIGRSPTLLAGENRWEALSTTMVEAFLGLPESLGHYANMVNPDVTSIGVGIALKGSQVYITQDFAAFWAGSSRLGGGIGFRLTLRRCVGPHYARS